MGEDRDWKDVLKELVKPVLSVLVRQGFERLEERVKRLEQRLMLLLVASVFFLMGFFFLTLGLVLLLVRFGVPLDVALLGVAGVLMLVGGLFLRSHGRRG